MLLYALYLESSGSLTGVSVPTSLFLYSKVRSSHSISACTGMEWAHLISDYVLVQSGVDILLPCAANILHNTLTIYEFIHDKFNLIISKQVNAKVSGRLEV